MDATMKRIILVTESLGIKKGRGFKQQIVLMPGKIPPFPPNISVTLMEGAKKILSWYGTTAFLFLCTKYLAQQY